MTENHARKEAVRRVMAETGLPYQAALAQLHEKRVPGADAESALPTGEAAPGADADEQTAANPLPNANEREDFIDSMRDADLPGMVKVCLYELASRMDLTASPWSGRVREVRYERREPAAATGLDIEATRLCLDIAIEANWAVPSEPGLLTLHEPHADLDLWLRCLDDHKNPISDKGVHCGRLAAFLSETDALRTRPLMSVRPLRQAIRTLGYGDGTLAPCTGSPLAKPPRSTQE